MKLRGPAASLNPTREAARALARAANRHTPGAAGGRPAADIQDVTAAGWRFDVDERERVCLVHDATGTRVVIAAPNTPTRGDT